MPLPPRPPLFPYTTLFRSPDPSGIRALGHGDPQGWHHAAVSLANIAGTGTGAGSAGRGLPVQQYKTTQRDRKSTRLNSSHVAISYAVFCLKKKKKKKTQET